MAGDSVGAEADRAAVLDGLEDYRGEVPLPWRPKLAHMRIGSATNARTAVGSFLCGMPAGDTGATLFGVGVKRSLALVAVFGSFAFDFVTRCRVSGLHIDYHVIEQNPLCSITDIGMLAGISRVTRALCLTPRGFAPAAIELIGTDPETASATMAVTISERLRLRAILDAAVAAAFGLTYSDLCRILDHCDLPSTEIAGRQLNPKGFWRLDRKLDPELRHTVLTLVAFRNLESKIHEVSGDRDDGIREFFAQNGGEGWLLPETLRLADYGLGHDDRALRDQPVAGRLGPRFYDWQLAQSADVSLHECHLLARNLLGREEYARFIAGLGLGANEADAPASPVPGADGPRWMPDDGSALRAAEPKREYTPEAPAAPPQTEILRRPQADLFE